MHCYCIKDHRVGSKGIFLLTNVDLKTIKNIILFIQAKINLDICDNIFLESEEIAQLLIAHYGFIRKTVVDASKPIEVIDLVQVWNENIERIEDIIVDRDFKNSMVMENGILKSLNKHTDNFIFINVAAKLPKWGEDTYMEPLSLQVTHNGVLIQGLSLIAEEERNNILVFYPASKFYDNDNLFFSFEDFPPYQYSFSWNGRHISVMQVKESDYEATEIIKQMNIGYYLNGTDMKLPINTYKDFQILKKKMRLG